MVRQVLITFILLKVFLMATAIIASYFLPLTTHSNASNFDFGTPYLYWIWGNFDGVNYLSIARFGYQYPNFAFFPLLPLLISLVHKLTAIPLIKTGILVSNTFLFLSLFLLYKIVLQDFPKRIGWRAIVFALVFPTSFFYGAVYTDALYLFLSLLSFYFARKSRWILAGIAGYFAGLARLIGVVLLPALLLEWYLQNKKGKLNVKTLLPLLLIPMGVITYGMYLQITSGDFFLFQKAMAQWNQEKFVFPPQVFYRYIKIFLLTPYNFVYFVAVMEFVATIFYFFLSFYVAKKIRISYGVLMFFTLLIPMFTGTLQSMPRYILHLFPAFIALALLTNNSKKVFWASVVVFLVLQALFVAFFTRGYFIS